MGLEACAVWAAGKRHLSQDLKGKRKLHPSINMTSCPLEKHPLNDRMSSSCDTHKLNTQSEN